MLKRNLSGVKKRGIKRKRGRKKEGFYLPVRFRREKGKRGAPKKGHKLFLFSRKSEGGSSQKKEGRKRYSQESSKFRRKKGAGGTNLSSDLPV